MKNAEAALRALLQHFVSFLDEVAKPLEETAIGNHQQAVQHRHVDNAPRHSGNAAERHMINRHHKQIRRASPARFTQKPMRKRNEMKR